MRWRVVACEGKRRIRKAFGKQRGEVVLYQEYEFQVR